MLPLQISCAYISITDEKSNFLSYRVWRAQSSSFSCFSQAPLKKICGMPASFCRRPSPNTTGAHTDTSAIVTNRPTPLQCVYIAPRTYKKPFQACMPRRRKKRLEAITSLHARSETARTDVHIKPPSVGPPPPPVFHGVRERKKDSRKQTNNTRRNSQPNTTIITTTMEGSNKNRRGIKRRSRVDLLQRQPTDRSCPSPISFSLFLFPLTVL